MPLGPLRTILAGENLKTYFLVKLVLFFEVYHDPNVPISTHMNNKRMQNLKSAHQITSGGTKTRIIANDVFKGHWPRMTSADLWRSQCWWKKWMSPRNTYACSYRQYKYRSSQVSGVETVRNADFGWHDLGNQVTGQRSRWVQTWNFQGRCKIVQKLDMLSFVTIVRSVRVIHVKPEGVTSPPVPARVKGKTVLPYRTTIIM